MAFVLLLLWLCSAQAAQDSSSLFVKVAHHRSQIRRSFKFPPRSFGERTEDVRLVGNAAVMNDGSIRIPAQDWRANQAGRALFASPVRMWDPNTSLPASFDTTFSFIIQRPLSSPPPKPSHESGGGLAFIIAPDEMTVGRDAGYLGMLNDACVRHRRGSDGRQQQHSVIAVEFDTFQDQEFGDPNDNHVGLNLGSVISNETADLSNAGVYLRNGSYVTARISYDSSVQQLQVRVSSSAHRDFDPVLDDEQVLPLISTPVDLSSFLKEYMFVGFSASTGAEALSHTFLSWSFSCASHAVQRFPPVILRDTNNKEVISHREECEAAVVEDKFDHASGSKGHPPAVFFAFVSVSAAVLFFVLIVLMFWRRSRARTNKANAANGGSSSSSEPWIMPMVLLPRPRPLHRPREFDLPELVVATGDFAEKQKLGQGKLGVVYRGSLQDGSPVAIKVFSNLWPPSSSGVLCVPSFNKKRRKLKQQLVSDVLPAFSRLRHPHLVPVRGWCDSGSDLMVVYEYMPNASLDKWLHPAEALLTLPWIHRWKLAGDVAAALLHLHSANFLHRRVKSSNVLMDITFQARLGDFGLVLEPQPSSSSTSSSKTIHEYHVPPEILDGESGSFHSSSCSKWTQAMDVYGFGILCFELVSGDPPCDGDSFVDRAWLLHEQYCGFNEFIDARLEGNFVFDQAMILYGTGLLCTHPDPRARPSMQVVASLLERKTEIPPIPARVSQG